MAMLTLDEFEYILGNFEWALAIEQFLTTDWTSSAPSEPNRPSWVLGHSYSEFRSFISPTLAIAATLAGSSLAEFLPDRMHYTLQEVVLTLVVSTVNGTFTVSDLVAEFSESDAKRDVQHWGKGSSESPVAGAVLIVRDLVPPSGRAPPWNGVSQKVRHFIIIPNSLKKAVGYLRLVRIYPHLVQVSTGTLSPSKGQPEELKWPLHFDPSVIAALLSNNSTERFVPTTCL